VHGSIIIKALIFHAINPVDAIIGALKSPCLAEDFENAHIICDSARLLYFGLNKTFYRQIKNK